MFDAQSYMQQLTEMLVQCFGERLVYVGLQGSYLRGEATEDSDIDPMVVIDSLLVADLDVYRSIIQRLDTPEKSCGFICGKAELTNWNPLEMCHLRHTTKDYYGELTGLVPSYTDADMRNFVKLSVNNLFHEICHRYVHKSRETNSARIAGSFKAVFFILQDIHYLDSGVFAATKKELLPQLSGKDAQVLETEMALSKGVTFDFSELFELLYSWCQETIARL